MEKTVSRSFLTILYFSIIFLPASSQENTNKPICQTEECFSTAHNLRESMNVSFKPCDNFFMYACGNWQKHQRRRSSISQTALQLRSEKNDKEILDFLQRNDSDCTCEPYPVQQARELFSLCLKKDTSRGISQIFEILREIGIRNIPFVKDTNKTNKFDYTTALARAHKLAGVNVYFNLGVIPNPYNQTENLIALKRPAFLNMDGSITPMAGASTATQTQLREYVTKIMIHMCKNNTLDVCQVPSDILESRTPFNWMIEDIMQMSGALAALMETATLPPKNSNTPDIGIYSLYQLQTLSDNIAKELNFRLPKLNWTRYIEEMFTGLNNVTLNLSEPNKVRIVVEQQDFQKNMLRFIYFHRTNLMSIECDIWWQIVTTLLPYVDLEIPEDRKFLSTYNRFRPNRYLSRKSRCAALTTAQFGMGMYYAYFIKQQHKNAKTEIDKMFKRIRTCSLSMAMLAPWIDEMTEQRAIKKIHSVKSNIAYPDITIVDAQFNIDDLYIHLKIYDNFFYTMIENIQIEVRKNLKTLNQPNNLNEDFWTPLDFVNGYYIQDRNSIVIPAGLIGGSIYTNSLRAWDYGAIGSIIGRELSRAYVDPGRYYNEIGNIEDWWSNETSNLYKRRINCIVKANANYRITLENGFTLQDDVNNSIASAGGNIADYLGYKASLLAYRRSVYDLGKETFLPYFEYFTHEQLHTLAYANVLCENPTWTLQMKDSNRISNMIRVNELFKNSWEFAMAWKCPSGSAMNPYPSSFCQI